MDNYTDTESAACTSLSTGTPSAWIHKSNGLMVIVKEVPGEKIYMIPLLENGSLRARDFPNDIYAVALPILEYQWIALCFV